MLRFGVHDILSALSEGMQSQSCSSLVSSYDRLSTHVLQVTTESICFSLSVRTFLPLRHQPYARDSCRY